MCTNVFKEEGREREREIAILATTTIHGRGNRSPANLKDERMPPPTSAGRPLPPTLDENRQTESPCACVCVFGVCVCALPGIQRQRGGEGGEGEDRKRRNGGGRREKLSKAYGK